MALYMFKRLNASSAVYKDTNKPEHPGYKITDREYVMVAAMEGDYNAQIALAYQFDANAAPDAAPDEPEPPVHQYPVARTEPTRTEDAR